MSDSFADLWTSSAPKSKAPTLASASSASSSSSTPNYNYGSNPRPNQAKPDVFAMLAGSGTRSGTSTPSQQQRYGNGSGSGVSAVSLPSSRPISALGGQRSGSGTPAPAAITPSSSKLGGGGGGDAFGDLFSSASHKTNHAEMTLAERLAMEAKQRASPSLAGRVSTTNGNGNGTTAGEASDAWAGLDSLAGGSGFGGLQLATSASSTTTAKGKPRVDDHDDWGLGDFGSAPATTTTTRKQAQPAPSQPQHTKKSLWDIDDFASPSANVPPSKPVVGHVDSPDDDFDFGNREDGPAPASRPPNRRGGSLLALDDDDVGHNSRRQNGQRKGLLDSDGEGDGWGSTSVSVGGGAGEDDILGMLSKPVHEVVKSRPEPTRSTSSPSVPVPPRQGQRAVGSSPPPHLLGRIVEMGFSVEQAKRALAATKDGRDVETALEMLLAGVVDPSRGSTPIPAAAPPQHPSSSSSLRPAPVENEAPPRPRGAPKGAKERERERQERLRRERERDADDGLGATVADVQEQADKLISQASEIGLSVFNKASAFWKQGREKVQKVYEERAGTPGSAAPGGAPRWMQESGGGFKDDDDDNEDDGGVEEERRIQRAREQERARRQQQQQRKQPEFQDDVEHPHVPKPFVEEEVDLFSSPAPAAAPSQRPSQRQQQQLFQQPSLQRRQTSRPPTRPITPVEPPRKRTLPSASPSALSSALKHKTAGTQAFKLGQYGDAVEAYTKALAVLPKGHLLTVPLYTNRALARMRTGEFGGAAEDAGGAVGVVVSGGDAGAGGAGESDLGELDPTASKKGVGLIVTATSWTPSMEASTILAAAQQKANEGGWTHPEGLGVDLCDGYVKALKRRAEASEGMEKWKEALRDWEVLSAVVSHSAFGGVGGLVTVKKEAERGGVRCRKMVAGGGGGGGVEGSEPTKPQSKPAPKPKPKPRPSIPTAPSAALASLQATTAQAEADDALKHQLKDVVEARLNAWRTGKETNIRALLASLDMVLWDEALKGVRVSGLHELVSPGQVKKGYVRVIGRVHPDKINVGNSTVEQRMLANGVFGTLNEAWLAFQASSGR